MNILGLLDLQHDYTFDGKSLVDAVKNIESLSSERFSEEEVDEANDCLGDIESNVKDLDIDFVGIEQGVSELEDKLESVLVVIVKTLNNIDNHKCKTKEDYDSLLEDIYSDLNKTIEEKHKVKLGEVRPLHNTENITKMLTKKGLTNFEYSLSNGEYVNNFSSDNTISFETLGWVCGYSHMGQLEYNGEYLYSYNTSATKILDNPFELSQEDTMLLKLMLPEYADFVDNFIVNEQGEYIK